MKINLEFANNEIYRIPNTMMHHLITRAVSTLCAIIIRDNRQMDTDAGWCRLVQAIGGGDLL